MRFVCWNERTTSRVIGYHENAVKITSIGRAKATAARCSPRTHARGERRSLAVAGSPEITSRLSTARSRAVTLVALTLRRSGSRFAGKADGEPQGLPVEPVRQEASSLP